MSFLFILAQLAMAGLFLSFSYLGLSWIITGYGFHPAISLPAALACAYSFTFIYRIERI